MTRILTAVALAGGLLWGATHSSRAQDVKPDVKKPEVNPEPKAQPLPGGISPQAAKVNELIRKGWENAPKGGIKKAADRATDHEYMRRVFIDLLGRIPTPEEIRDFERDGSANKRGRLVQRLLNDTGYAPKDASGKAVASIAGLKMGKEGIDYKDQFAQNFAELWSNWMLTRSGLHPQYRNQFTVWLTRQFRDDVPWNQIVQRIIGAQGRTGGDADGNATVFVQRHLGDPIVFDENPNGKAKAATGDDLAKHGKFDAVPVTSRVTKLFVGIQSQCTQCHPHPHNSWFKQYDFWGVNAFFRQTDTTANPQVKVNPPAVEDKTNGGYIAVPQVELRDVPAWNMKPIVEGTEPGVVLYEIRDGRKGASPPRMLRDWAEYSSDVKFSKKMLSEGKVPPAFEGKTRRQVLAVWITDHDNFAKAFVNRMWGHLFGRGLNKEPAVDDFNQNNEVVHPELLDYLAEQFKAYNYDPKKLLEWICTSEVYNLSHVANKAYAANEYDAYFARMPLKALSPEVMFDSLAVATRLESRYDTKNPEGRKAFDKARGDWIKKLTDNFGDDEGNEVSFNGTVVQALLMMNGREINKEVGSAKKGGGGVIEDVMKKKGTGNRAAIYDELFLMTVSRHPTPTEVARLDQVFMGRATIDLGVPPPPKKGTVQPKSTGVFVPGATGNDDITFYQDVFWALLNSSEFLLNH